MSETRVLIGEMLAANNTMTIATSGPEGPWAATVFFVSDDEFNLYFVSDTRTRHGQDMAASAEVSVAVDGDCASWSDVRGLQLVGTAGLMEGEGREQALALFMNKFPEIRALNENPDGESERIIADRLTGSPFYRIRPRWIRLIDNAKGFGFKRELELDPSS